MSVYIHKRINIYFFQDPWFHLEVHVSQGASCRNCFYANFLILVFPFL